MTEESLNPYAPPQVDRQDSALDENVVLKAQFTIDDRFQRKIAYDLIMPGALLLTSSIFVLGLCMALGAILSPIDLKVRRQPNRYLLGAGLVGFPVGAITAVGYHIFAHQWLKKQNLRRLREHRVLQAAGHWTVEADVKELRVHTSAGIARFPLSEIWWHPPRGELVLLQLPGPIPLGIPKKCELEPPMPEEFSRLLKLRVRRVPFT